MSLTTAAHPTPRAAAQAQSLASSPTPASSLASKWWFEAFSALAILLPLLFVPQLRSAGPALFYGFMLIYLWVHRREALAVVRRRWVLMLVPAFALTSVIWSDYPGHTLKHALELTLTVAGGLLISGARRQDGFLAGACVAFGVFLAVSLALGHSVMMGSLVTHEDDQTAFTGLNGGKNLLGMTAAMGAVTSLFLFSRSAKRFSLVGMVVAAALIALEVYLIVLARSAGAVIAIVLATAAFFTVAALGAFPPRTRGFVCGCLVLLLAAAGMMAYTFANSITAETLDLFHKDPTLTGRSYLWYRAADFIRERPILGRGFEAFWVQGNIDAEGLWEYAKLGNRGGFNFHNTLIELLVHFGWVGTCLVLAVFAVAAVKLLGRTVREPTLVSAAYVGLVVFHVSRTPFESLAPSSVDFATLFLVVALGYGFEPASPLPVKAPPPAPRIWLRRRRPRSPTRFPTGAQGLARRAVSPTAPRPPA